MSGPVLLLSRIQSPKLTLKVKVSMAISLKARAGETAEQMLRRFKKLCEKEGLTKEMRKRMFHEKPSEIRQRERRRLAAPKKFEGVRRNTENSSFGYGA
jgi:small subunit ribosomal protein S21